MSALGFVFCAGISLFMPPPPNPVASPTLAIGARLAVPAQTQALLKRACYDCHSNETRWPVYSRIWPGSAMIYSDVSKGRATMNFSDWQDYSRGKKVGYLALIQNSLHKRIMPPVKYTALHFHAKLSAKQLDAIEKWTVEEMQRLMHEK